MTVKPAVVVAPSFGPAVVVIAGQPIPVMAAGLAVAGLILARLVAPPPKVPMTRSKAWALTGLLTVVLLGGVITMQPTAGTGVALGVGLGYSGMLAIEFLGSRVTAMLKALTEGK